MSYTVSREKTSNSIDSLNPKISSMTLQRCQIRQQNAEARTDRLLPNGTSQGTETRQGDLLKSTGKEGFTRSGAVTSQGTLCSSGTTCKAARQSTSSRARLLVPAAAMGLPQASTSWVSVMAKAKTKDKARQRNTFPDLLAPPKSWSEPQRSKRGFLELHISRTTGNRKTWSCNEHSNFNWGSTDPKFLPDTCSTIHPRLFFLKG